VIPVATRAHRLGWLWLLCSFQRPSERACARERRHGGRRRATRSLKTQQHARARAPRYAALARPGSVDMLGRTVGGRSAGSLATEVASEADGAVPYGHLFGAP
jgi:hypothetical protein